MSENKYREMLTAADVPDALDMRILAAARISSAKRRHRRFVFFRLVPAAGIAAAFAIGFGIMFSPAKQEFKTKSPSGELLAMNDWSELDQLNFNLSFELDSGITALADNSIARGF